MAESFVMYRSFIDTARKLPDSQFREFILGLADYALDHIDPEPEDPAVDLCLTLALPQIYANEKRRSVAMEGAKYGHLGGRPRKKPVADTEEKPGGLSTETRGVLDKNPGGFENKPGGFSKETPGVTQETRGVKSKTPNVNVNDNVNVNANVNENENDNGDLFKGLPPLPPPGPAEATPLTGEPVKKQDPKITLGKYRHVQLTHREYADLCLEFPDAEARIQRLDDYMEQSGKKYNSHYATIKNWARRDKEKEEAKRKQKIGTFGFSTPDGYGG